MSAAPQCWTYNTTRVTAAAYHTRVGLGYSRFVRHYYGNCFFSSGYLDVSVPPLASLTHVRVRVPTHNGRGLPHSEICGSACKRLPAAFRSVTTSFFGPACLGIHHLPFLACISPLLSSFSILLIGRPPSLTSLPTTQGGQVTEGRKGRGSRNRSEGPINQGLQRIHG